MKKISLLLTLALTLAVVSCENYDDDFKDLNASISDLNSAVAELKSQVAGFASLQTGITALQGSVTALQTAVNSIPGGISGLESDLADAASDIVALQTALNSMIANYATSEDLGVAQEAINALTAQLTAQQEDVQVLLESNNVYTGALNIRSAAELDFAIGLGEKVRIVNGAVDIDYTNLTATQVAAANVVTKKIAGVIGNVEVTGSEDGIVDLSALKSVTGDYDVFDFDASDDSLAIVTGDVLLDYDGGYVQTNLISANSVEVVNYATTTGASAQVGTLVVNFRNLVTADFNTGTANTAVFTHATEVILNEGVDDLTANAAEVVQVWASENANGLDITATEEGSVITIAGDVVGALSVLGNVTSVVNANGVIEDATIVTITALEVNMNALTEVSTSIELIGTETVSLPSLEIAGTTNTDIEAADATSFSAPLLAVIGTAVLDLTDAETITLASVDSSDLTSTAVETLTLTALSDTFDAGDFTTLVTVDVTGDGGAFLTGTTVGTNENADLVSATFAGELTTVVMTDLAALTTFSTEGAIDQVVLDNAAVITAISLGHSHIAGGDGSVLIITNNAELASLTTSTDFLNTLTVTGNPELVEMDFSSYVSVIDPAVGAGAEVIDIDIDVAEGTYVAAVPATPTTAAVPASWTTSTSLASLVPFVENYLAAVADGRGDTGDILVTIVDLNETGVASPSTGASAIDTFDKFLLIEN